MQSPLVWTYPRVKLAFSQGGDVPPGRGSERRGTGCQVGACQIARAQLKKDRAQLESQLCALKANISGQVEGHVRAAQADVLAAQRERDEARESARLAKLARGCLERRVTVLAAASVEQTQMIAQLKGELAARDVLLREREREASLMHQVRPAPLPSPLPLPLHVHTCMRGPHLNGRG